MNKEVKLDLWVYFGIAACAVLAGLCYSPSLVPAHAAVPHGRFAHNAVTSTPASAPARAPLTSQVAPLSQAAPSVAAVVNSDPSCQFHYSMMYSQLRQCMESKNSSIGYITAINGLNEVVVYTRDGGAFEVSLPSDSAKEVLSERAIALNIPFDAKSAPFNLFTWLSNNIWAVGILLMVGVSWYFSKRQLKMQQDAHTQASSKQNSMTKSKAKDYKLARKGQRKLTFDDLRGCDEAVAHGKLLIDMHENFPIYKAHKAPFPRGYLLVGPPGVGKTLWVRTLADVLDGEVFVTAGSEFVEMFVGVGPSRARDLVEQARAKAVLSTKPVLILIDEIDAMGGKRGVGSNDEREATLNQMLVEMDGLLELGNVIFIGATNRPDMLDPALLRRLAHRIVMDNPDLKGRVDLLDLFVKDLVLASDVSVYALAKRTYDFSGDLLQKSVHHAATLAAKRCVAYRKANKIHKNAVIEPHPITMDDFDKSFDYIKYGDELPSKQKGLSALNKRNTSAHEACHLVAGLRFAKLGWLDPVVKATIMRRSRTLGFVLSMPQEERTGWNHRECLARIIMLMAGRAGQEVFLNTRDSGASGDFQQATDMAREMVTKWNMTDAIGPISVGQRSDGGNVQTGLVLSDKIDQEWVALCKKCMDVARQLVKAEVKLIKVFTLLLEEKETILEAEINRIAAAVASEFDASSLEIFGNLDVFEENMFDSCEVLPVDEYLAIASPVINTNSPGDNAVQIEDAVESAVKDGSSHNGNGENLTEGAMA
ncbi:MAG: AAA family ATPase [Candidatus Obscuribacterales bacterium]|nr:AAA family ATPase [Candidatus Obscuribacterales bacterium]